MAITRTDRGEAFTTGGVSATNTVTSTSFSPLPGARLVVIGFANINSATNVLSVTDTFAGTSPWVEHATITGTRSGYTSRLSIFSTTVGATPGAGTVTVTRTAGSIDQWLWAEVAELAAAGPRATATATNLLATSLALAMNDTPAATSIVCAACANDQRTTVDLTQPAGFTLSRNTTAPVAWGSEAASAYQIGNSPPSAHTWTFPTTGGQINLGASVEFVDAGPFNTPTVWRSATGLR